MSTPTIGSDRYCLGSCMTYCDECKLRARWAEVGEFSRVEREMRWPGLIRVSDTHCQLSNGTLFEPKETNA